MSKNAPEPKPPKAYRAEVTCPECGQTVPIAVRKAGPNPLLCKDCGAQVVVDVPADRLIPPKPFVARVRVPTTPPGN
jgi:transcription elongation factor Elf1